MIRAKQAQQLIQTVDERRGGIVELVRELVRIPSETHPPSGDEYEAQLFMQRVFTRMGLDVDVFEPWCVDGVIDHPGWWPGFDYDRRPNVVGTWRGTGGGRSLILNGHIDVVPAGPLELWNVAPYDAVVIDGHIHGRGAADMKSGLAASVMAVDCLQAIGFEPRGDVTLESVVNEELGGFNGTLSCCVRGYEADAAIVTEPTGGDISAATKGGQAYRIILRGESAHHGWWWRGVSALDKALVLKAALKEWETVRADEIEPDSLYADRARFPVPALADTIWHLSAGDPSIMATPSTVEFDFWVDLLPSDHRETTLLRFENHLARAIQEDDYLCRVPPYIERQTGMRPFDGASIRPDHPVVDVLSRAHTLSCGSPPGVVGGTAANDAMIFNRYSSTPAVVYGPGSTQTAHGPNENVAIDDVIAATKTLALTILDFAG